MTALFGWPVWNDPTVSVTPTYSGGSWAAGLPLTNLSDRRLAAVARSTDAAVTSTLFTVNLLGSGSTARYVKLVAIPKHTISSTGTVRVRLISGGPGITGLVLDFGTGWTSVGTPTRSAAASTGTDGVPLDLIGDDAAGTLEGYTRVFSMGTTGAVKSICLRVKQGTSTSSAIRVRDTTAGANRLLGVLTWSGGLPSVAMTTGTFVGYTAVGGAFRLSFLTTSVTTTNTNQIEIYPATDAALSVTGTGDLYCGDLQAFFVTADRLIADSGYMTPWPAGLTAEDVVGLNVPFVYLPTEGVYSFAAGTATGTVQVDINDTTNAAGYVDLSRLIVASAYQPTVNILPGSGQGLEDLTTRTETDGGAAIFTERAKRRTVIATLDEMQEAEMFTSFWKMQKQCGISGQFFFMWDSADTTYKHDRAFLAVFRSLDPITMAAWPRYRAPFQLVEEI